MHSVQEMAEDVLLKLDIVLKKLEMIETELDHLGSHAKNVDAAVKWVNYKLKVENSGGNSKKCIEVYRRAQQRIVIPEQQGGRAKETGERLCRSQTDILHTARISTVKVKKFTIFIQVPHTNDLDSTDPSSM